MEVSIEFVLNTIQGELLSGDMDTLVQGVSTDSRKISPGDLFIALTGDHFDGNFYAADALQKGAAGAIVSALGTADIDRKPDQIIIKVNDTLQALQDLAHAYRKLFKLPIIAITGSVGKTTTKEILAALLSTKFKTLKTPGNYNNEIGMPLSLLQLNSDYQAAVFEMGMRARGQINQLAKILEPDYAIISNVAPVHLETLGSMENIAAAKCEVLGHISSRGFALLNGDNEVLLKKAREYNTKIYTFGYSENCDFKIIKAAADSEGISLQVNLSGKDIALNFPVPATQMAMNIISAAGLAYLMGVKAEDFNPVLHNFNLVDKRLNIKDLSGGGAVINDTYNANPLSMQAALEVLQHISNGRRKVAILGDMYELGDFECEGHYLVGQKAAENGVDLLITIGERGSYIAEGAKSSGLSADRIFSFADQKTCLAFLQANLNNNDVVLFKASRGMQLDILLNNWLQNSQLEV